MLIFLIKINEHPIDTSAIQGIITIAGTTFTPAKAIATILAIRAVINNERKTR